MPEPPTALSKRTVRALVSKTAPAALKVSVRTDGSKAAPNWMPPPAKVIVVLVPSGLLPVAAKAETLSRPPLRLTAPVKAEPALLRVVVPAPVLVMPPVPVIVPP